MPICYNSENFPLTYAKSAIMETQRLILANAVSIKNPQEIYGEQQVKVKGPLCAPLYVAIVAIFIYFYSIVLLL